MNKRLAHIDAMLHIKLNMIENLNTSKNAAMSLKNQNKN